MNDNLKKLEQILTLLDDGKITHKEFEEIFAMFLEVVKELKTVIDDHVSNMKSDVGTSLSQSQKTWGELEGRMTSRMNDTEGTFLSKIKELSGTLVSEIRRIEKSIPTIKDHTSDIGYLEDLIKAVENKMPVELQAEQVRDKLETLKGEESFGAKYIWVKFAKKDLETYLQEEFKKINNVRMGGVAVVRNTFIDDETPTGTVNGSNTDFVINLTAVTGSLKVYVNGQRMRVTEDYTFNATTRTITFLTAPPTNSIILVDYRI